MAEFNVGTISSSMELDRAPFQRELAEARREGERFEGTKFEAKAGIDTSEARRELASLAAQAGRMGAGRAQVGVAGAADSRRAVADLARQVNQFGRIKAKATVGLVGARDVSNQLRRITQEAQAFGRQRAIAQVAAPGAPGAATDLKGAGLAAGLARLGFRGAGEGAEVMGRSFRSASTEVGGIGLSFNKIGPAAGLVAAKFAAVLAIGKPLVVGLAAIVASAAKAAVGLGALGVAAGGALVAGLVLGAVTIARYNREAQKAGTMSNRVARELRGLRGAFARVMAPGVEKVLSGVASALQSIRSRLRPLRSAFGVFGGATGRAIRTLGRNLSRLIPDFSKLVRAASPLAGHIARGISGLAKTFLNIARAAMPSLNRLAKSIADTLTDWGKKTSNVRRLRGTIEDVVKHLKSWWNLGKQVGSIILGIVRAWSGGGKGLVDSLGKGAKHLADWVNSKRGQEQLKKVFEDMKPVLKDIWNFIKWAAGAVIDFGKWAERVYKDIKPVVTEVKNLFDALVGLFGDQRTEMQKTQQSGQGFRSFMKALASVIGWVAGAVKWLDRALTGNTLSRSFEIVGRAVSAVLSPFKSFGKIAADAFNWVKKVGTDVLNWLKGVPGDMLKAGEALLNNFWEGMKRVAQRMLDWARGVWKKVKSLLPGSEPKDVTSPLYNLSKSGEATIENYLAGVRSRSGEVDRVLRGIGVQAASSLRRGGDMVRAEDGSLVPSSFYTGGGGGGSRALSRRMASMEGFQSVAGLTGGGGTPASNAGRFDLPDTRYGAFGEARVRGLEGALRGGTGSTLRQLEQAISIAERGAANYRGTASGGRIRNLLRDLQSAQGYHQAVSSIEDTFRSSEGGLRGNIIQRIVDRQTRAITQRSPVAQQLAGLQREETGYQRRTAIGDLNLQLAEANMMRDVLGAGRIRGEIGSQQRQFQMEDVQARIERQLASLERWSGLAERGRSAEVEGRLRRQQGDLGALSERLRLGRISPEQFRRQAHQYMLRKGIDFDLDNEAMSALEGGGPLTRAGGRRRRRIGIPRGEAGGGDTINVRVDRVDARDDEDVRRFVRESLREAAREQERKRRAKGRRTRGAPAGAPAG